MRCKAKKKIVLIIVFLQFLVVNCFSQSDETIKIGSIFAKTGASSVEEVGCLEAVRFAVEEVNNNGGVLGRKIVILEIDNQSMPIGAKKAAIKAVKQNVVAVIGASWSSHSLAMAPVLQEAGIPMISPASTNPKLTLVGDYIFRACFTDSFQGKVMSTFARKELNAKTAVIIKDVMSDYSMGLADSFRAHFSGDERSVLVEIDYMGMDIKIDNDLDKVLALSPDVIFIPGHEKDSSYIISHCRKKGIKSIFLGADGWSPRMYELYSNDIEGSYFSTHWNNSVQFPKSIKLQEAYKSRFGKEVMSDIALVYDAFMILCDAIKRAGAIDRKKIRDAIASTKNFDGVTGHITIDQNGDPINKDAVILKFEGRKSIFIKTIKPKGNK